MGIKVTENYRDVIAFSYPVFFFIKCHDLPSRGEGLNRERRGGGRGCYKN